MGKEFDILEGLQNQIIWSCIALVDYNGEVIRELMSLAKRVAARFELEVRVKLHEVKSGVYFIKVLTNGELQKQWEVFI